MKSVKGLLDRVGLPTSDLFQIDWQFLLGWRDNATIVGVAGYEHCDNYILLRSVAISPNFQGQSLATKLVSELHTRAKNAAYVKSFLLTMDADDFFKRKFGYSVINRSDAPLAITQSTQFSQICPGSAVLMEKRFIA